LRRRAQREGLKPAIRLNGTSDINWQLIAPNLFKENQDVQFYDYTKNMNRDSLFNNYDITYSASEQTPALMIQDERRRIAIVFKDELPSHYLGRKVVNGDSHDLRFLNSLVIVGLRAKGQAKKLKTGGFVNE
jgi:hypothetical protein